MAEIRKHHPQESAIGRAVREAMGESVQPVTPGETDAATPELFDRQALAAPSAPTPAAASLGSTRGDGSSWVTLGAEAVRSLSSPIRDRDAEAADGVDEE